MLVKREKPPLGEEKVTGLERHIERLVEKTENVAEHLKEVFIFRKIRLMGSKRRVFFVLVVGSAVILYWRGLWSLFDLFFEYVLPDNRIIAAFISILVGAAVLAGTGKIITALGPPDIEVEVEQKTKSYASAKRLK